MLRRPPRPSRTAPCCPYTTLFRSGQPGFKSTPAGVEKVAAEWSGFLILRGDEPVKLPCLWSTRITVPGGALYEIAGNGDPARLDAFLPKGDRVEAMDASRGPRRVATISEGRLNGVSFVPPTGLVPPRTHPAERRG